VRSTTGARATSTPENGLPNTVPLGFPPSAAEPEKDPAVRPFEGFAVVLCRVFAAPLVVAPPKRASGCSPSRGVALRRVSIVLLVGGPKLDRRCDLFFPEPGTVGPDAKTPLVCDESDLFPLKAASSGARATGRPGTGLTSTRGTGFILGVGLGLDMASCLGVGLAELGAGYTLVSYFPDGVGGSGWGITGLPTGLVVGDAGLGSTDGVVPTLVGGAAVLATPRSVSTACGCRFWGSCCARASLLGTKMRATTDKTSAPTKARAF
jgi:hypothetical protein